MSLIRNKSCILVEIGYLVTSTFAIFLWIKKPKNFSFRYFSPGTLDFLDCKNRCWNTGSPHFTRFLFFSKDRAKWNSCKVNLKLSHFFIDTKNGKSKYYSVGKTYCYNYLHHNVMRVTISRKWLPSSHCDEGN